MLNFEFLEKGLGIVSLLNFVNDLSRKMFLMLYSIYDQISLLKKMKFSITDFFSKYDKIHSFLRIWSYLLKKSLMESLIFCSVFLCLIAFIFAILGDMCVTIFCFPGYAISFEINLIFLIKPFFCTTKKSRQKFKYLENGRSF